MTPGAPPPGSRCLQPDAVLLPHDLRFGQGVLVAPDGAIAAVGPVEPWIAAGVERVRLEGRILIPGAVNAHSHAFQILHRGLADRATSFRDWVDRYLYPLVLDVDEAACAAAARLAFAEMLLSGVTTVGEFWYIHNDGPAAGFAAGGNRYPHAVIGAAREVGIRIALLRALYDRGTKEGQRRFHETPEEAARAVRALHADVRDLPRVTVGAAPHSLHGASEAMLRAGMEVAGDLDLPLHVHVAEERSDLDVSKGLYGTTPGRALARLGLLTERFVAVHACWLDAEEIALLGAAHSGLAYNPCSNMALGDGVTDIERMVKAGVTVALGCDGACANNQVCVYREARTAEHLQRVSKLRMNVIPQAAGTPASAEPLFAMATRNGGRCLRLPVGEIAPGQRADLVAIDPDDPSLWPHGGMDRERLVANIVFSMTPRSAVTDVFVDGRDVVRDRRLVTVDLDDVRAGVREWERRQGTTPAP